MVSYVGVVAHPYFAVSGSDGAFRITGVPAGKYPIRVWHERYGRLTASVDVKAGQTATVDFAYKGTEQPSTAGIQDLVVPGHTLLAHKAVLPTNSGADAYADRVRGSGSAAGRTLPRRYRHATITDVRLSARPPRLSAMISGYQSQGV
jgi:hypothetical protein